MADTNDLVTLEKDGREITVTQGAVDFRKELGWSVKGSSRATKKEGS